MVDFRPTKSPVALNNAFLLASDSSVIIVKSLFVSGDSLNKIKVTEF